MAIVNIAAHECVGWNPGPAANDDVRGVAGRDTVARPLVSVNDRPAAAGDPGEAKLEAGLHAAVMKARVCPAAASSGTAAAPALNTQPYLAGNLDQEKLALLLAFIQSWKKLDATMSGLVNLSGPSESLPPNPVSASSTPKVAAGTASTPALTNFPGTDIPTQNPFGPDPYMSNPTQNIFANDGTGKMIPQSLAAYYFPTERTAQTAAQLFGGTVFTQPPDPGSPFTFNQPRYMVRLANGTEINPGIIAHFYETRSDTPVQLQQLIQDVLNGGTMATLQPNYGGYPTTA
jgi:hypothetical protein